MRDFITAAIALLPVIVFCTVLTAFSVWVVVSEERARKVARARERENRLTLEHIERVRQVTAADVAKSRRVTSPANQRTAAPWFTDGGDAA